MNTNKGSIPSRILPLKYIKPRRPKEINKAKITFAIISTLLHFYLITTVSFTQILPPLVSDTWSKPPRPTSYTMVITYPAVTDKKNNPEDKKRNEKLQKYKTFSNIEPDFSEKRRHLIKKAAKRADKRIIRYVPASKNKILLAKTDTVSFSVPSREISASDQTRTVKKLAMENKFMPRPRIKNIAEFKFGNQRADELQRYTKIIKDKIADNIIYPPLARRKGIEGIVLVGFLLTNNGLLRDIRLIEPSNYEILNRAAITTINNASPFLPFPESVNKKELWLKLALSFKLNQ